MTAWSIKRTSKRKEGRCVPEQESEHEREYSEILRFPRVTHSRFIVIIHPLSVCARARARARVCVYVCVCVCVCVCKGVNNGSTITYSVHHNKIISSYFGNYLN